MRSQRVSAVGVRHLKKFVEADHGRRVVASIKFDLMHLVSLAAFPLACQQRIY